MKRIIKATIHSLLICMIMLIILYIVNNIFETNYKYKEDHWDHIYTYIDHVDKAGHKQSFITINYDYNNKSYSTRISRYYSYYTDGDSVLLLVNPENPKESYLAQSIEERKDDLKCMYVVVFIVTTSIFLYKITHEKVENKNEE